MATLSTDEARRRLLIVTNVQLPYPAPMPNAPRKRAPGGGRKPDPNRKVRVNGYVSQATAAWLATQGETVHAGVSATLEAAARKSARQIISC